MAGIILPLYGTEELIAIQRRLPVYPDGFWSAYFPGRIYSDKQEVIFDYEDLDNRRMAPFVAPNVQGRVMREQGFRMRSLRPAYLKPKHIIDPSKAITRLMGEPLLGNLSLRDRYDIHVALSLVRQGIYIDRRIDWMCSQAAIYGTLTISGEDYPTQTVDFLRDPSLTVTLTGNARWDQSTPKPLDDIAAVSQDSRDLGAGPITTLIFGTAAWKAFRTNADVFNLLITTQRGSLSDFSRMAINNPQGNIGAEYVGFLDGGAGGGRVNMWVYSNWYNQVDEATGLLTRTDFLDPRDVVGIGGNLDGRVLFGAIMDRASMLATDKFPKQWDEQDPSRTYTMTQSAPLPFPANTNNSWRIRATT